MSGRGRGRASEAEALRVVLADDHDVVRHGLRLLLESNFGFDVLEASTAADATAWGVDPSVGLVLLDVRLPDRDGLWALTEIRKARPELPIIMLSTFADDEYVQRAIEGGANGYLLKEATTYQLREAIETALDRRGLYLHPSVTHRVMRRREDRSGDLSPREIEVLRLLVEGARNEEIARRLSVTEKTVKSHLSSIYRKLEVSNRTQATAKAIREGIVTLRED